MKLLAAIFILQTACCLALAGVGFVVESSTNQVDWIERARLAAPPFVFVPTQAQEFFRVAAYPR